MDSENDNEKVNMPLFPSPEPSISCIDDLDFFKDFENEFPAIVYNDNLTSKSDFSTEPTLCPQHIDEFDLKDETSLSEYDEVEQNVLYFNDLFPFNIIYPDDLKSDKDNDDNEIDMIQSSGGNENTQGSNNLLEGSHDKINKVFIMKSFVMKLNVNIMAWNYLVNGMLFNLIKNLYVPFGILFDPRWHYKDGDCTRMLRRPRYGTSTTEEIVHDFEKRFEAIFSRQVKRVHILDFEGLILDMRQDLAETLRMVYTRDDGVYARVLQHLQDQGRDGVYILPRRWQRTDLAYWLGSERVIPDKGDLSDYWVEISFGRDFLRGAPSYTYIRDPVRRLRHMLILYSISGRGQALVKVTATDLFYLHSMDRGAANVMYLLAQYLFRHAKGRNLAVSGYQEDILLGILLITLVWQPDAAAGAPRAAEDAPVVDEGAQADPAPVHAPQPLPLPPAAGRTMPQRLGDLRRKCMGYDRIIKPGSKFNTIVRECVTEPSTLSKLRAKLRRESDFKCGKRKEYERIFMCNTAKEIWKTLLITHQDESIDSAFAIFNTIINSLKSLDKGYSSKKYVRKFLRALHPKWRAKVMAIEESKDLTSLSLDELIRNLKAKKKSSDEECFRLLEVKMKNTTWPLETSRSSSREENDSGEEDDEKVKDETCLVAQASNEAVHDKKSPDFDLFSDQEDYSEEEVAETMAETMEQYMSKTRADYGSGFARPKIEDKDNFELKGQFFKELRTNTLRGSDHEDANEHIENVLEIMDLLHIRNITIDQVMLRAFPMSLTGAASRWLKHKPSGSITTWEDLKTKFSKQILPTCSYYKENGEIQEAVLFYNGFDVLTRQILDSRGATLSKTVADAKIAI
ncbi:retrovirus-related pol polyprotein from transposon opus [Tanacetum coccineum]